MGILFILVVIAIVVIVAVIWITTQKKKKINNTESEGRAEKIKQKPQKEEEIVHGISIPELIGNLYIDYIANFSLWIKNEKFHLGSLITEAVDLGKEQDAEGARSKTKISMKGNNYIFVFREYKLKMPNGSLQERGDLELFLNDNKMLGISMAKDNAKWKTVYIEMFIEGSWVEDFQELERKIEQEQINGSDLSKDIAKQNDNLLKKQELDLDYD